MKISSAAKVSLCGRPINELKESFFAFRSLGEFVDERILLRLFFEPRRRIAKE
jgi:hypothetical protein